MKRTIRSLRPVIAAAAVALTACGGGEPAADTAADGEASASAASSESTSERARTVDVSLTEYRIEMPRTVRAGTVVFRVANDGTEEHNFEIESGEMEEDLGSELEPGETAKLEVDLGPGTYEVYCPVDDHADRGMRLELRVAEGAGSSARTGAGTGG